MKNVPKEWMDFLREQYPVGSRIKLREMKDPFPTKQPVYRNAQNICKRIEFDIGNRSFLSPE